MSKNPYMPLNTKAYLATTRHLSAKEQGEYFLLLLRLWETECPEPTTEDLGRFFLTPDDWRSQVRWEIHPYYWPDGKWDVVREAVLIRDGESCSYCGDESGPFDIDHIHPKSLGGGNEATNLCVACYRCNRSKGAKPLGEWLQ